ncbi:hypothetical protein [Actinomadura sp. GTD37]|uniref:hypothetical protein n=1 Tax=Actinomadura sp. GTD37 TaxID=1778030 RepID=UPI0035BF1ECD
MIKAGRSAAVLGPVPASALGEDLRVTGRGDWNVLLVKATGDELVITLEGEN